MKRHCSLIVMASATLLMTVASMPTHANGLNGLGGLGNIVGGLTGTVDNTVNGVTGTGTKTTASLDVLGSKDVLRLDAKSQLLGGIKAKVRLLSHKELVKLCLSMGGGINPSPVAGLSSHEVIAYKKRCSNVLQYPERYDGDIVSICRLIQRQKA